MLLLFRLSLDFCNSSSKPRFLKSSFAIRLLSKQSVYAMTLWTFIEEFRLTYPFGIVNMTLQYSGILSRSFPSSASCSLSKTSWLPCTPLWFRMLLLSPRLMREGVVPSWSRGKLPRSGLKSKFRIENHKDHTRITHGVGFVVIDPGGRPKVLILDRDISQVGELCGARRWTGSRLKLPGFPGLTQDLWELHTTDTPQFYIPATAVSTANILPF